MSLPLTRNWKIAFVTSKFANSADRQWLEEQSKIDEDHHQAVLCKWLDEKYPDRLYYAVPNGAKMTKAQAALFKFTGRKSGVLDIVIPEPTGIYHGLYLELKHGRNNLSKEQKQWKTNLEARLYCCRVSWDLQTSAKIIVKYFRGEL